MIFSFLKVKYLKVRTNRNFKKQVFIIHHRIGSWAKFCWRFSVQLTVGSRSELFLLFLWILKNGFLTVLIREKILFFLFWFLLYSVQYVLKQLKEHMQYTSGMQYFSSLFIFTYKNVQLFFILILKEEAFWSQKGVKNLYFLKC